MNIRIPNGWWIAGANTLAMSKAKALMLASNQKSPLVVRANLGKTSREKLLASWDEHHIAAEPTAVSPQAIRLPTGVNIETLPGFAEGLFQVQSEASQLVSYLVGPASGDLILDACAAPGGKTTHLAELIGDQGNIIAIDTSARGVERINQNAQRLGLNDSSQVRQRQQDLTGQPRRALRSYPGRRAMQRSWHSALSPRDQMAAR